MSEDVTAAEAITLPASAPEENLTAQLEMMEDGSADGTGNEDCDRMVIDLQENVQQSSAAVAVISTTTDVAHTSANQPIIVQPTELSSTETSTVDQHQVVQCCTIAQTLQSLASPGSAVYVSTPQIGTQHTVPDCSNSAAIVNPVANGNQQVQFASPQPPQPVAMFSTAVTAACDDQHPGIQQQQQQQQQQRSATPVVGSIAGPVTLSVSHPQQTVCQFVAQQPAGIMAGHNHQTALQGMISPAPTIYGGGTQIMCSAETAVQSQMDMAMACQQQYIGSATIQTGQGFQAPLMALPQTLQVIQAAPHQFIQQQQFQQQYMFQTNPIQTFQQVPTAVSLSAPRQVQKNLTSTGMMPIAPQSSGSRVSSGITVSSKAVAALAPQSPMMFAQKSQQQQFQQQQQQAHNTSVVIGQLAAAGMIQNTNMAPQTIMPQQPRTINLCQMMQQPMNLGQVGQQLQFGQPLNLGQVGQPMTFGPTGQPITLGQVNQTLNLSQVNQVIGNAGQIRFATMPNFAFNAAGQLVSGGGQTVVNFQNLPMLQQQLLTSQPTTILGSQPLYIRTADPIMQQPIAVANVQAVAPIRNVVAPPVQTAQTPQPRRLQVQPNNAIMPSSTGTKPPTSTPGSSNKSSPKLGKPTSHTSPVVPKTIAPATSSGVPASSTIRPAVKPTMSVTVLPKPPVAGVMPIAVTTASPAVATVTAVPCPISATPAAVPPLPPGSIAFTPVLPSPAVSTATAPIVITPMPETPSVGLHEPLSGQMDSSMHTAVSQPAFSGEKIVANGILKETTAVLEKVKVKDDEVVKRNSQPAPSSAKGSSKPKKPKILTHVIEGFIIQEASEPFPVQGSSLISQLWTPRVPSTTDDGYSSPKSEKESEEDVDDEQDDQDDKKMLQSITCSAAKRPRLDSDSITDCKQEPTAAQQLIVPTTAVVSTTTTNPAAQVDPRLTCEFCGKRDFANNLTRSRRFCSVTCSKRFSAYSMRKNPDGSVVGRPPPMLPGSTKHRRSSTGMRSLKAESNPAAAAADAGTTAATTAEQPASSTPAAPRIASVKATTMTSSNSESEDTTTPMAGVAGDSSSPSQSPPALERVERLADKDSGDDGVLIPPRPLAQWGVRDVYDFIRTLPGCGMYADEFRQQEIDGSALMLLKEDHLMMTMNVKLGPALKICSRINSLPKE